MAFPENGSKQPQMDLVNYSGERFGAVSCPACQPAWHPVGACQTLPGGQAAGLGRNTSRGAFSGQSLVTLPRGRLWFVTRNTVCSLETLCTFAASVCVCVPVCVHVGGFGLKMAKTHNCHDATALGQGPGSCLKMKPKGFGVIFLCNPQWLLSPTNPTPNFVQ